MTLEHDRAVRAATVQQVPVSGVDAASQMFDILTGGSYGAAGTAVTEQTAMRVSAVYACVSLIGGALASLPFHLYRRTADGRDRYDSDLWWLFNESPSQNWTAAAAWQFVAQSITLKGDAFWRIRRVSPYTNAIEGFEPIHPDRVQTRVEGRNKVHIILRNDGVRETIDDADMLQFTGMGYSGERSVTPIRAQLLAPAGIALAADEYAGAFFRNGARPDFALTTDKTLNREQVDTLRQTWAARHAGPSNAHMPAVLQGGLKVEQITMTAEDAQLLATRKFQVEDIARIFGVPPHMIGHTEKTTSWGSGVEQMSIGFVRFSLRRCIDLIQQEINRKIWPRSRQFFGEFNTDALLDGDSKAQAEYFAKALGGPGSQGWMTPNEVRRLKNMKPLEGGDKLVFAGAPADTFEQTDQDTEEQNESDAEAARA